MGFSRHEWPLMCCICFEGLTEETCAPDQDGSRWDVCRGQCALESGLVGTPVMITGGVYAPEFGWLAGCQGTAAGGGGYLIALTPELTGLKLFCLPHEVRGVVE